MRPKNFNYLSCVLSYTIISKLWDELSRCELELSLARPKVLNAQEYKLLNKFIVYKLRLGFNLTWRNRAQLVTTKPTLWNVSFWNVHNMAMNSTFVTVSCSVWNCVKQCEMSDFEMFLTQPQNQHSQPCHDLTQMCPYG